MPLANGVHILECIPKKEKLGEGATLYNFFDVAAWCTIFYHHLFTKSGNFRDSYNYMVENFLFQGSMKWWRWENK